MDRNFDEQERQGTARGQMTVRQAGHLGGKIGGEATRRTHGHEFYSEIGHKGGARVRELIQEGKLTENKK